MARGAALAFFVIGSASCATKEQNASRPVATLGNAGATDTPRMGSDPVSDLSSRVILGILTAVEEPAHNPEGQTIIYVPDLVNRSSAPSRGVVELGTRLRAELAAAGEGGRLVFTGDEAARSSGAAHYVLAGEVFAVQRQGQRYWEVFFTLFEIDPATGRRADRRWENARGYLIAR